MAEDITVKIEGARDSDAEYDENGWLAADATTREAITAFYDAGASIDNIEEAVRGALLDAEAGR